MNFFREKLENVYVSGSHRRKDEIIADFIEILEDPEINDKISIVRHFRLYIQFIDMIESMNNSSYNISDPREDVYMTAEDAGFEYKAGYTPRLSRIEIQNGEESHNQFMEYDIDDEGNCQDTRTFLSAEEMHAWLLTEHDEYSDYVGLREAIKKRDDIARTRRR